MNFYPLCHNFDQFSGEWPIYKNTKWTHRHRAWWKQNQHAVHTTDIQFSAGLHLAVEFTLTDLSSISWLYFFWVKLNPLLKYMLKTVHTRFTWNLPRDGGERAGDSVQAEVIWKIHESENIHALQTCVLWNTGDCKESKIIKWDKIKKWIRPVVKVSELFLCLLLPFRHFICLCLCVSLPACPPACPPVCPSVHFHGCLPVSLSLPVCVSTCLSACLPIRLSICVSVCLSVSMAVCLSLSVHVCLCISISPCLIMEAYALEFINFFKYLLFTK